MALAGPPPFLSPESVQKLEQYVKERQKAEGGFALTPRLPATVEDTFYAVRLLELLGSERGLDSTRDYLARLGGSISGRAKIIYEFFYLQQKFGLLKSARLLPDFRKGLGLEDAFYWREIASLLGVEPPGYAEDRPPLPGLPSGATLKDLCYFLGLQQGDLTPPEKSRWLRWVQACQTPAGGFGFKPGTTAFMDNVLPALEILQQLGGAPANLQECVAFILACQARSGGFARNHGGVAFLESSYQALKSLHLLGSMLAETPEAKSGPEAGGAY
jgi:hypothetical protein